MRHPNHSHNLHSQISIHNHHSIGRLDYNRRMPTAQRLRNDGDHDAEGGVMGLLEHLDELRSRLIKACIAVGIGMTGAFVYATPLAEFVVRSMKRALPA